MNNIPEKSVKLFVDETCSKAPVPGGGGIAALTGSLGAALSGMVCYLTTGKKKYACYEEDIQRILKEAERLKDDLLSEIDKDAENFLPLSKCYGLPAETEEEKKIKDEKMQAALKQAVAAPVEIVKLSYKTILLHEELKEKGSKIAISDVGCGVLAAKAAMEMGWLNTVINLKSIKDKDFTENIKKELLPLIEEGSIIADKTYKDVLTQLS